jgi:gliding motility-associated-like protein
MGIPNAFTPNGDGKNDFFRAKYGIAVSQYRMRIFNRFGQLIFDSRDQLKGWDGNFNGKALPAATYAWMVQYNDIGTGRSIHLRGTVTLIR